MVQHDEMELVLYVGDHRLAGAIKNSGYRLLDILNDRMSEFLELYDVRVAADGAEPGNSLTQAVVAKARITLAAVLGDQHEAEERRRFSAVEKSQHPAFAIVDGFEIRGAMHLEGRRTPSSRSLASSTRSSRSLARACSTPRLDTAKPRRS